MPPHRAGITVTITNLQNTCFHWCNIESPIQSNCIFPLPASLLQSPIYKTCVSTGVTENHQFKAIASFRCQHHCYNHQFTKHSLPSNTPVGFGFRIITHKDSRWDFSLARTDNFGQLLLTHLKTHMLETLCWRPMPGLGTTPARDSLVCHVAPLPARVKGAEPPLLSLHQPMHYVRRGKIKIL